MFPSKTKNEEKPKIKLKVTRPSSTYCDGDWVEGKILITGIKRKINSLSIETIGCHAPSSSEKVLEAVPQLTKLSKFRIFEYENQLVKDYLICGSVKKSFKFQLTSNKGKPLLETYYGYLYATKYTIFAKCKVDDTQEGQAKVEIQLRSYVDLLNIVRGSFAQAAFSNGV